MMLTLSLLIRFTFLLINPRLSFSVSAGSLAEDPASSVAYCSAGSRAGDNATMEVAGVAVRLFIPDWLILNYRGYVAAVFPKFRGGKPGKLFKDTMEGCLRFKPAI
jgi:hypothetical protein